MVVKELKVGNTRIKINNDAVVKTAEEVKRILQRCGEIAGKGYGEIQKVENVAFEREKQQNAPRFIEKGKITRVKEKRDTSVFRTLLDDVNKMKGRVYRDT